MRAGLNGTRLYHIWVGMKQRCQNPKVHNYRRYGGRGIAVCEEWQAFPAFRDWALANGYRHDLSIDRWPDGDGNYEPGNCRWATWKEQNQPHRKDEDMTDFRNPLRAWLEKQPRSLTQKVLAEELGIARTYLVDLTREDATVMPSYAVMARIEDRTGLSGRVFLAFIEENRKAAAIPAPKAA